jgi:hypothetical protein
VAETFIHSSAIFFNSGLWTAGITNVTSKTQNTRNI